MKKSLFITGTGTDIGKTYVSALITKQMRECGFNCGYFKPVLSGAKIDNKQLIPGDCEYVVKKAKLNVEPISCLSYCFEEAISPHLASKRLGIKINKTKILNDYARISEQYDYMVIEGAGGITCPICADDDDVYLMSDLIKEMNTPVLIVADGGLGTLNHILLTVEYAKQRNIEIKGIALNNFDSSDFMHKDNLYMTEKLTGIKVVMTVEKNTEDLQLDKTALAKLF